MVFSAQSLRNDSFLKNVVYPWGIRMYMKALNFAHSQEQSPVKAATTPLAGAGL
jgi:hypothetical protein